MHISVDWACGISATPRGKQESCGWVEHPGLQGFPSIHRRICKDDTTRYPWAAKALDYLLVLLALQLAADGAVFIFSDWQLLLVALGMPASAGRDA
jgi:hypothetical protein